MRKKKMLNACYRGISIDLTTTRKATAELLPQKNRKKII